MYFLRVPIEKNICDMTEHELAHLDWTGINFADLSNLTERELEYAPIRHITTSHVNSDNLSTEFKLNLLQKSCKSKSPGSLNGSTVRTMIDHWWSKEFIQEHLSDILSVIDHYAQKDKYQLDYIYVMLMKRGYLNVNDRIVRMEFLGDITSSISTNICREDWKRLYEETNFIYQEFNKEEFCDSFPIFLTSEELHRDYGFPEQVSIDCEKIRNDKEYRLDFDYAYTDLSDYIKNHPDVKILSWDIAMDLFYSGLINDELLLEIWWASWGKNETSQTLIDSLRRDGICDLFSERITK